MPRGLGASPAATYRADPTAAAITIVLQISYRSVTTRVATYGKVSPTGSDAASYIDGVSYEYEICW
jgi:hypothetical protein